ncbi:unnamed protein product [Chrysoparadoxa australica]
MRGAAAELLLAKPSSAQRDAYAAYLMQLYELALGNPNQLLPHEDPIQGCAALCTSLASAKDVQISHALGQVLEAFLISPSAQGYLAKIFIDCIFPCLEVNAKDPSHEKGVVSLLQTCSRLLRTEAAGGAAEVCSGEACRHGRWLWQPGSKAGELLQLASLELLSEAVAYQECICDRQQGLEAIDSVIQCIAPVQREWGQGEGGSDLIQEVLLRQLGLLMKLLDAVRPEEALGAPTSGGPPLFSEAEDVPSRQETVLGMVLGCIEGHEAGLLPLSLSLAEETAFLEGCSLIDPLIASRSLRQAAFLGLLKALDECSGCPGQSSMLQLLERSALCLQRIVAEVDVREVSLETIMVVFFSDNDVDLFNFLCWASDIFFNAKSAMTSSRSSPCGSCLSTSTGVLSDIWCTLCDLVEGHLHPIRMLAALLCQIGGDKSVLLDWLISPETQCLLYLTRTLKLMRAAPAAGGRSALTEVEMEEVYGVLNDLREALVSLRSKGLFPYDSSPLIRLLEGAINQRHSNKGETIEKASLCPGATQP